MKYIKKRQRYEASNLTYDPLRKHAVSYRWWDISRIVGGQLVINRYSYSISTIKHIRKVERKLKYPKDALYINVYASSLNSKEVVDAFTNQIAMLYAEVNKPRSHKKKNEERLAQINYLEGQRDYYKHLLELERSGVTKEQAATLNTLRKGE